METLAVLDPYVALGLAMTGTLVACLAILFLMRDTTFAPPRKVSESVYCPTYERRVVVDFIDRVRTGLRYRSVEHCPLREEDERCGEDCCVVRQVPSVSAQTQPPPLAARSAT